MLGSYAGTNIKTKKEKYKRVESITSSFLKSVKNRWNQYLEKLLPDSTETFFILKDLLLYSRETINIKKNKKFVIFKSVARAENMGKKWFQASSVVIFKKFTFFVTFNVISTREIHAL